jgi:1,4-dihydroxy-2-naphthoate octaprenyltransferase
MDQVDQVGTAAYVEYHTLTGAPISRPISARPIRSLTSWIRLCRPPTLLLGLAPVLITLAYLWATGRQLLAPAMVDMIISVLLVLAGASMLDEYLEFERSVHRRWNNNGGSYYAENVLEGSGLNPLTVLRVSCFLLLPGVLLGLPLILAGGVPLLILGALGLVAAVLYSSTNLALKRLPAGELVIFLALGPGLAIATALSQGDTPSLPVAALGLTLGLFTLALVLAAHLRDQEADKSVSRRTLVMVNGQRVSYIIYTICLFGAYILTMLVALPENGARGAVLAIFSLPAALIAWTGVTRALSHRPRQMAVRQTLRAYTFFALWTLTGLLAAGLILRIVSLIQGSF